MPVTVQIDEMLSTGATKARAMTKCSDQPLSVRTITDAAENATAKATRAWVMRMLRWGAGASNIDFLTNLLEEIGLRTSREVVSGHGEWLAERGYLTISHFESVTVYRLTRQGDELGRGIIIDEGVMAISLADVEDDEAVVISTRAPGPPA